MMSGVWFLQFPLSHSDNHSYSTLKTGRRIRSEAYQSFLIEVDRWHWTHLTAVKSAQHYFKEKPLLFIRLLWTAPYSRFFCKDGRPRKIDASNRTKSVLDALAKILEIDDSYFFGVSIEKCPMKQMSSEWLDIHISEHSELTPS